MGAVEPDELLELDAVPELEPDAVPELDPDVVPEDDPVPEELPVGVLPELPPLAETVPELPGEPDVVPVED